MGSGKSTFTAIMVKELLQIEKRPVYIWIRQFKLEDTLQIYEKQLGAGNFHVRTSNLIPPHLEKLKHSIVVIEDAPSWLSTKSKNAMECLVSSYGRANDTLAVIVSQKPQALPTSLTFELTKKEGEYFYRALEERRATAWFNWTNAAHLDVDKFVLDGVKGEEMGRRGKAIDKDSKRQKAFELFSKGCSNSEIATELKCNPELVRYYRWLWKKLQHLNTNAQTLGEDEE
ncbi:MAG: hypothetical protein QXX51_01340 [Candidatus Bathyarchaeia archaeon]